MWLSLLLYASIFYLLMILIDRLAVREPVED